MTTNLLVSDMTELPLKSSSMDYIVSVAALHHLTEKDNRTKAISEMARVLKDGGECLITVWNKWNRQFILDSKVIDKEWNYKGETLVRNYYLYNYFELKKDLEEVGFEVIRLYPEEDYNLPIKYFSKNIIALVKKDSS